MSKVHQALKKAEMERIMRKDALSLPEIEEKTTIIENIAKNSFDEHLVALLNPKSIAAEQYRKLRTRILQFPDFAPKTILITSSTPQEGKTLTAANLATVIAQGIDQHVLLVDGDLRCPMINRLFGLKPRYGLTDYLTRDIDLSQVLEETGVPKLKILSSGSPSDKPSELIASKKMRNLVQELKSRYEDRYIIIDSSPLAVTNEPDILADQVDGIIFVVRAGKTPKEVIRKTLDVLSNRNILGIVFNDFEFSLKRVNYDYYGYYRYGY